jgi:hypothetical protein
MNSGFRARQDRLVIARENQVSVAGFAALTQMLAMEVNIPHSERKMQRASTHPGVDALEASPCQWSLAVVWSPRRTEHPHLEPTVRVGRDHFVPNGILD